ncbi:hypothetical protein [Corynebacterium singulare]|uniref:Lipoprotein n=2 Tax=Corynebacterium TaxID=1716 RepID=A0A0B6F1L8_9CORY|nr:hypothetical protein [Corynebacterium singulare]AJI78360.1 hypothetical protein CSING_04070 [Corynebacterium singulare]
MTTLPVLLPQRTARAAVAAASAAALVASCSLPDTRREAAPSESAVAPDLSAATESASNPPATSSTSSRATRSSTSPATSSRAASTRNWPVSLAEESCDPNAGVADSGVGEFVDKGEAPTAIVHFLLTEEPERGAPLKDFKVTQDSFDACEPLSYIIASGNYEGEQVVFSIVFNWGHPLNDSNGYFSGDGIDFTIGSDSVSFTTGDTPAHEAGKPVSVTFTAMDFGALKTELNAEDKHHIGIDLTHLNDAVDPADLDEFYEFDTNSGPVRCRFSISESECDFLDGEFSPAEAMNGPSNYFLKTHGETEVDLATFRDDSKDFLSDKKFEKVGDGTYEAGTLGHPIQAELKDGTLTLYFPDGAYVFEDGVLDFFNEDDLEAGTMRSAATSSARAD